MLTYEHGGNIHKVLREQREKSREILDFSANINPPPEWFRPLISSQLEHLVHYPDPDNTDLVAAISDYTKAPAGQILVGNGSTELLYLITRTVPAKRAIIPVPSYIDYVRSAELGGLSVLTVPMLEVQDFELDCALLGNKLQAGDMVIVGMPNNPTGGLIDPAQLTKLINNHLDCIFVIDEAFLDFQTEIASFANTSSNVITLHSMTKFYGVPGLRLGYSILPQEFVGLVGNNLPPWTVNNLAQAFGVRALGDSLYQQNTRDACRRLREDFSRGLCGFSQLKIYPSKANYLFLKLLDGTSVGALAAFCLKEGIMIRNCANYQGLDDRFFRIAVRSEKDNARLLSVFSRYFTKSTTPRIKEKKTRSIMFQGTCSDAGKSILTAAMCRVLYQDGYQVAPFKAQNMSLNSFVTRFGEEMGRAQVVQAQAARLEPDARMNPILLKPNSDTGSQIIVRGKPVGNMSVLAYDDYKPKAWQAVKECYDSLTQEYDVIVLEGAGSPGEVNLKANDIVNMRMAAYAEAPVILVGDIDRGGVYASFVGIMEVLAEWERKLVAGFIVNKFRGQASLLHSAHSYLELHTGRKVLGVVPYLFDLGLPEEDSVSFKKGAFNRKRTMDGIDVVVISLPHISNFTDVEPFLAEPDVTVRIVESIDEIGNPEAIILPGSKNVIHDMLFLRQHGFLEKIRECFFNGCELVGICGGYQLLGRIIRDPYGIESSDGQIEGLGYLDLETVIEKEKNLTRKSGMHQESQAAVYGYEIHHGISTTANKPLFQFSDGSTCGMTGYDGRVWGSYLHGIFDGDSFRRWFIDRLRIHAGLTKIDSVLAPYNLEKAFDRLAEHFRKNVDVTALYQLLGL